MTEDRIQDYIKQRTRKKSQPTLPRSNVKESSMKDMQK